MTANTSIEWTDHTFNPWWGCERMSPGCQHCYAESAARRWGTGWGKNADRRFFGDKHWAEPLAWDRKAAKAGRPALVFCASMADVFEDRDDLDFHRTRLWDLIYRTPNLRWLLLTKRPQNVLESVPDRWLIEPGNLLCDTCGASASLPPGRTCLDHNARLTGWPDNVWVGTTVENQARADERIGHLRTIPAPVRFLSCEPLLGPLDLDGQWLQPFPTTDSAMGWPNWVIAGGESGPGARPMHPDWARSLRDQCTRAGVPFLFKQWGAHDEAGKRVGRKAAGRVLDGHTHDAFPPEAGDRTATTVEVTR